MTAIAVEAVRPHQSPTQAAGLEPLVLVDERPETRETDHAAFAESFMLASRHITASVLAELGPELPAGGVRNMGWAQLEEVKDLVEEVEDEGMTEDGPDRSVYELARSCALFYLNHLEIRDLSKTIHGDHGPTTTAQVMLKGILEKKEETCKRALLGPREQLRQAIMGRELERPVVREMLIASCFDDQDEARSIASGLTVEIAIAKFVQGNPPKGGAFREGTIEEEAIGGDFVFKLDDGRSVLIDAKNNRPNGAVSEANDFMFVSTKIHGYVMRALIWPGNEGAAIDDRYKIISPGFRFDLRTFFQVMKKWADVAEAQKKTRPPDQEARHYYVLG